MASPSQFTGQNWLIVPATPLEASGDRSKQKWLLTLTGVRIINLHGQPLLGNSDGWAGTRLNILPDMQSPLLFALNTYGIPHPSKAQGAVPFLNLDPGSAPLVTANAVFSLVEAIPNLGIGAGFRVDSLETITVTATDFFGNTVNQVFQGVTATVLARNLDQVNRVSYSFTLIGQIVFLNES